MYSWPSTSRIFDPLADAEVAGADTLVTCGGVQSNHCRATAFAAAKRGLSAVVLLRVADPARPPPIEANTLLDRLAGAELRFVSHDEYRRRAEIMAAVAAELRAAGRRPYVIPEGGSSALGSLGYVDAVAELRAQLPEAWRSGPVPQIIRRTSPRPWFRRATASISTSCAASGCSRFTLSTRNGSEMPASRRQASRVAASCG